MKIQVASLASPSLNFVGSLDAIFWGALDFVNFLAGIEWPTLRN